MELLAPHRTDPYLVAEIDDIEEDDSDADPFPSAPPGELNLAQWLVNRVAGSARLTDRYVDTTAAETVAGLHPLFKGKALASNLKDFDAAAMKKVENRLLTQGEFPSMCGPGKILTVRISATASNAAPHGDDLLWAVYERYTDRQTSAHVTDSELANIGSNTPELRAALTLLGLTSRHAAE